MDRYTLALLFYCVLSAGGACAPGGNSVNGVPAAVIVDTAGDTAHALYREARARIQVAGQGDRWFVGAVNQPRGPGVREPCLVWAQGPRQSVGLRYPPIYRVDEPEVRRVQVSARYYGRPPSATASVYRMGADTKGERWREGPRLLANGRFRSLLKAPATVRGLPQPDDALQLTALVGASL